MKKLSILFLFLVLGLTGCSLNLGLALIFNFVDTTISQVTVTNSTNSENITVIKLYTSTSASEPNWDSIPNVLTGSVLPGFAAKISLSTTLNSSYVWLWIQTDSGKYEKGAFLFHTNDNWECIVTIG